jgi:tRNA(His) 5'-end guanylyltransferase
MQRLSAKTAEWEIYSQLKVRSPIVVRADGRGFRKVLEDCKKPYDLDFARCMVRAAERLFLDSGIAPNLAFTFSDEISMVFQQAPFAGRVEKVDSVIAGFLSASLSLDLGRVVCMDCRIIALCENEIIDYLVERQDETWRNHVFSYGFYMLMKEGLTAFAAMERLRGMKESEIHELVFQKGTNLSKTPVWEKRGILVYRKDEKLVQDWEPKLFRDEEGHKLLRSILRDKEADQKA